MVARTTTREAMTQGTINRLREHGITLMQVSAHNAADFCIYYENVIVSINGPHPVYPSISAINGGPPFHPQCAHVLTPFVERLATEAEMERGRVDPSLLNRSPADLQRQFRQQFPERARAEGLRLRQQAARHRARLVRRAARKAQPEVPAAPAPAFRAGSAQDARAWQERHFGDLEEKLTRKQWQALQNYQNIGYSAVNAQLRKTKVYDIMKGDARWVSEGKALIKQMDGAFRKVALPEDVMLYRGIREASLQVANDFGRVGNVIGDAGYGSTSLSEKWARRWASQGEAEERILLAIRAPKGTHALSTARAPHPEEFEVILPRGARFRITSIRREASRVIGEKPLRIVEMEVVGG